MSDYSRTPLNEMPTDEILEEARKRGLSCELGVGCTLGDYILTELDILEKGLRALLCQWRGGGVK